MKELDKCVLVRGNYFPAQVSYNGEVILGYTRNEIKGKQIVINNTYNELKSDIEKFNIIPELFTNKTIPTPDNQIKMIPTMPQKLNWKGEGQPAEEYPFNLALINDEIYGTPVVKDIINIPENRVEHHWKHGNFAPQALQWQGGGLFPFYYFEIDMAKCASLVIDEQGYKNQHCSLCEIKKGNEGFTMYLDNIGDKTVAVCSLDLHDYLLQPDAKSFDLYWEIETPIYERLDSFSFKIYPQSMRIECDADMEIIIKTSYNNI